ncbi:MAG TPA: hypothetical protein VMZ52_01215 [Bryobacteraceae bacterium]|nr:hypothetical protein [Bryobacteraceae bacterium]
MSRYELDSPEGFIDAVCAHADEMRDEAFPYFQSESIYCATCGQQRRVWVQYQRPMAESELTIDQFLVRSKHPQRSMAPPPINRLGGGAPTTTSRPPTLSPVLPPFDAISRLKLPAVFVMVCVQCDATFTAVVYLGPQGRTVVILANRPAGVTSPHTPKGVAYYLDQAARAHSSGANTAAITMFRSAAEWLLEDEGFKRPMLGPKLKEFQNAIDEGVAPAWAAKAGPVIAVLKDLGNMATHTNAGDLSKQANFDSEFYSIAQAAFQFLLDLIYEEPSRHSALLGKLQKPIQRDGPGS